VLLITGRKKHLAWRYLDYKGNCQNTKTSYKSSIITGVTTVNIGSPQPTIVIEEFFRGKATGIKERLEKKAIRGEITLIVGGIKLSKKIKPRTKIISLLMESPSTFPEPF